MAAYPVSLVLLLAQLALFGAAKNAAVLLNNSKYYYNYRMVSNVMAMANSLQRLGFTDNDLVLGSHQASFNYPANTPPNTQRLYDDDLKYNLLTPQTRIALTYEDVSLHRHLLAFNGRHEADDPIWVHPLKSTVDHYLVYLTGHGGDKYMKIQYLQILFSRHFSDFFEELFVSKKVKKSLVISDTCSAGTLFYTTSDRVRAFLLGSSAWDDYSVSEGFDKAIGQPLRDKFSSRFHRVMDNIWKKNAKVSFEEIVTTFDRTQIDSTLLSFNHLRVPRKQALVNDFLVPPRTHTEVFSLNESAEEMRALFFGPPGNY